MKAKRSILDVAGSRWSFSADQAANIIEAVGLPIFIDTEDYPDIITGTEPDLAPASALAWHLNNTAVELRWEERRQSMPASREVAKRATEIAELCERLRAAVCDIEGNVHDGLGSGALYAFAALEQDREGEAVMAAIAGVERLKRWASLVAEREGRISAAKGSPKLGRKRDDAWHKLIDRLSGVYFYLWRQRPKFSRKPETGEPGGPYFRFVRSVVTLLLPGERTDEAIAKALSNHRWPQWPE